MKSEIGQENNQWHIKYHQLLGKLTQCDKMEKETFAIYIYIYLREVPKICQNSKRSLKKLKIRNGIKEFSRHHEF